MTITDIAKLAGVSISTVSKVVNGKNADIAEATREKVLRIVKEYNYSPYASVRAMSNARSLLLGLLLRGDRIGKLCMDGILGSIYEQGYTPLTCLYENEEEKLKYLTTLTANGVDGLLLESSQRMAPDFKKALGDLDIPYVPIDLRQGGEKEEIAFDYERYGYETARKLVDCAHQRIACFVEDKEAAAEKFLRGYRRCLQAHNLQVNLHCLQVWEKGAKQPDIAMLGVTGAVCQSVAIGLEVTEQAHKKNLHIPRDFSVVCLDMLGTGEDIGFLSQIPARLPEYGRLACEKLVARLEGRGEPKLFAPSFKLSGSASLDVPPTLRNGRIVVVGSMNMDTLVNVNCLPKLGETTSAAGQMHLPGGKGINQAIGCAKLGMETCLIGRVGKDYEAKVLFDALNAYNIDLRAVKTDKKLATGHAYIYVQDDGESSIVIYQGANARLRPADIASAEDMFKNASYCLLQTEISMETVEASAKMAKEHGARVLLKPAAITEISDELLRNVDIFLPNRSELGSLCPGDQPLEQKAQHFLDRGVKNIIVTLAQDGCYFRDTTSEEYFPAADFTAVDTTGAADAFAAALTVYLSEKYSMRSAIRYALCAAGFSITRQGVPPSLIDRDTLELLITNV